jgi:predicted flap endonuclease-1-like 5' DNA nuclease
LDNRRHFKKLIQKLDSTRDQTLKYIISNVKGQGQLQAVVGRVDELFGDIKLVLEQSRDPLEKELDKIVDEMREEPGAKIFWKGLSSIEGIGENFVHRLKEFGIKTTLELLGIGATPKGRATLAKKTGASTKMILNWVNRVDLSRIRGVGTEYADLLKAAGVDTTQELAQRNPQNLYQKLVEVNAEKKIVRQLPGEAQVRAWVEQAKQLPRVIEY